MYLAGFQQRAPGKGSLVCIRVLNHRVNHFVKVAVVLLFVSSAMEQVALSLVSGQEAGQDPQSAPTTPSQQPSQSIPPQQSPPSATNPSAPPASQQVPSPSSQLPEPATRNPEVQPAPKPAIAPPALTIPRLSQPPSLEDFLTMQPRGDAALRMAKITGFTQRNPHDG